MIDTVFVSSYIYIKNGRRPSSSGPVVPLINFFGPKVKNFYILEQPLPGSDFVDAQLRCFKNNQEISVEKKNFFVSKIDPSTLDANKTYFRLKIRDILSNSYFTFKNYQQFKKEKIDLFIGVESLNAIFGIILKKFGLVKTTVYYIFDWAPDRYPNPVVNWFYILLDKIATYFVDYTWNITYTIGEARVKILHFDEKKLSPQLYVPYSVDFNPKKILSDSKIDKDLIIYSGGLIEENGPKLLLQAFKMVMAKHPKAKLLIIGGGNQETELREYVQKNKLEKNVEFTGYVADPQMILDLQKKGAIGVAPYPAIKGSRKPFGDVIKIRTYFISGLVTVSTPVPPVAREIKAEKLGYCCLDDSPEEIAKGIMLFLENQKLLFSCRKNVIEKAKKSNWETNYRNTLKAMKISI